MEKVFTSFGFKDDWDKMLRGGEGVWVDEVGEELREKLEAAWSELPEDGFLGGPSWGCGPLADGSFVMNSRRAVEQFRGGIDDGSERFLGDGQHPCWMIFKRKPEKERVLLVSGCDPRQMNYFGKLTKRNHEGYAKRHGYETRWHVWDAATWGNSREDLVWAKLKVVADALAEGRWDQVWWIDADAAIVNLERRLDGFLHPEWDGVFTEFVGEERAMLSTGVFGARVGLEKVLRNLWETGERGGTFNEETGLIAAVEERPENWKRVQAVNHDLFNGIYGWNINFSDPERTFVCHFMGRTNGFRRKLLWEMNRRMGL